jgi:uncharacterized membrane protein YccC
VAGRTVKTDAEALLFSAKCFCAAMLAYYISLRMGLSRPYWAIGTTYIVSQTSSGATLSRGLYRFCGTLAGATATVVLVPTLANEPLALSGALACWMGFCLYLSLLDRTPRAYGFVLAGYTTSLIGFTSVAAPGSIYDVASMRVQEIVVGILCGGLMHGFLLPSRTTVRFNARVRTSVRDVRLLAEHALQANAGDITPIDRNRVAADLLELQGVSSNARFDLVRIAPSRRSVLLLHDRLARLLPLTADIEDRLLVLRNEEGSLPADAAILIDEAQAMLARNENDGLAGARVLHRHDLKEDAQRPTTWDRLLVTSLRRCLEDLIRLTQELRIIEAHIADPAGAPLPAELRQQSRATGYVYHRDPVLAARAASGTIIGIFLGCVFWIFTGWSDGSSAISILGVCCALFGNVDEPAPNVLKYLLGSIVGVALAAFYCFAVLPRVADFTTLVAVLAPTMLAIGSMQARPNMTLMALGAVLTFPVLAGLTQSFSTDFAAFANASSALLAGTAWGVVSVLLFQTLPVGTAISRLRRAAWRDVARRARGRDSDEDAWTSLMIDRTALLAPRLAKTDDRFSGLMSDMLRILRMGHAAQRLRHGLTGTEGTIERELECLLACVSSHFQLAARTGWPPEGEDMVASIDALASLLATSRGADPDQRLVPLSDLRILLSPNAPPAKWNLA